MKITILTDNPKSWVIPYVEILKNKLNSHDVIHIFSAEEIQKGDIMFILSCEKILKPKYLNLHKNNIVIHPSKLPQGKGWSPLAWQILEGSNSIPVTLFEACSEVDAGDIYFVDYIQLEGHELNDEIKSKQGEIMISMIIRYLDNYNHFEKKIQIGEESFYKKRSKLDNKLDVELPLKDNFNILRIADNDRYPAYFELNGYTYILKIYKENI